MVEAYGAWLIDGCLALIQESWTSLSHLAIPGTPADGITVGRAMTERPELFAAVIADVGLSNLLRAEFSENGPSNIDELGTINERKGFAGLWPMDAYLAVRDDISERATLRRAATGWTSRPAMAWAPPAARTMPC